MNRAICWAISRTAFRKTGRHILPDLVSSTGQLNQNILAKKAATESFANPFISTTISLQDYFQNSETQNEYES